MKLFNADRAPPLPVIGLSHYSDIILLPVVCLLLSGTLHSERVEDHGCKKKKEAANSA